MNLLRESTQSFPTVKEYKRCRTSVEDNLPRSEHPKSTTLEMVQKMYDMI